MAKVTEKTKPVLTEKETDIAHTRNLTVDDLLTIKEALQGLLDQVENAMDFNLSSVERLRKRGSGIKRYGFIDKTSDIAIDNTQFAPRMFDADELKNIVRKIEELRNVLLDANQFARAINDLLLIAGDEAYKLALLYYGSLREQARRGVQGAQQTFRILQPFFRTGRRPGEEPTEHEVERDLKALLHGKKDGKIVIENERPHLVGGKHVVVDETHKERAAFKETESGEI